MSGDLTERLSDWANVVASSWRLSMDYDGLEMSLWEAADRIEDQDRRIAEQDRYIIELRQMLIAAGVHWTLIESPEDGAP